MSPPRKLRLAIVVSHPTQYYSPWFRFLSLGGSLNLKVFYLWDFGVQETRDPRFRAKFKWDVDLLSGYESVIVPNKAKWPGAESFFGFNNPMATRELSLWKPDVILLFGYHWYTHLRVILWARLNGVPLVFRGDSHFIGRSKVSKPKALFLNLLYRQFAAVTYVGLANLAYFRTLGVSEQKLFFAPHSVNDLLFDPATAATAEQATVLRRQLGIGAEIRVVLFAGKFVSEKQPLELLEAFLATPVADTALVYVGEGEAKALVQARTEEAGATNVFFLPFANQSEMPARYRLASVFALPSRGYYETWGLAVNEAMHLGVPCLVSNRVGCQQDLVLDGETGWVFDPANPTELSAKLAEALGTLGQPAELARIQANVRERISRYTYRQTSAGVIAAATFAARGGTG